MALPFILLFQKEQSLIREKFIHISRKIVTSLPCFCLFPLLFPLKCFYQIFKWNAQSFFIVCFEKVETFRTLDWMNFKVFFMLKFDAINLFSLILSGLLWYERKIIFKDQNCFTNFYFNLELKGEYLDLFVLLVKADMKHRRTSFKVQYFLKNSILRFIELIF